MAQLSDSQRGRSADPQDGAEVPALLIVGSDAARRSEFVSRLYATSAAAAGSTDAGSSRIYKLDTKYYTASVDICDVAPESAAQHPAAAAAEGVILVFSRHDASSLDAARSALQSAGTSAEVQLCVCNSAAPPSGSEVAASSPGEASEPAVCAAAQEWAAEHLFEYIEVDTADAAADAALQLDGEPQGMRRVLAALEAHMWPGLHRKLQPDERGGGSRDSVPAAGQSHFDQGGDNQSADHQPPVSTAAPAAHADASGNGGAAEPDEPFGSFFGVEDASPDDEADRKFAQLMGQMAGVREQLRDLPDAERLAGAEHMAMQMMQLLGIDDSDAETGDSADAAAADSQRRQQPAS